MESIKEIINKLGVIHPVPTGMEPVVQKDNSIKAIIFDIYGTLLVSASGDIDEASFSLKNLEQALNEAGIKILAGNENQKYQILEEILDLYKQTIIDTHQQKKCQDIPYPEINIVDVCQSVVDTGVARGWLMFANGSDCKKSIFVFEVLSNRTSPMPGLKDVIFSLHKKGYPLGIVSNAQFYTPVLLHYYLNDEFKETETVFPFVPDLTVYSYKHLRGKPDTYLYSKLIPELESKYHIKPSEALFVGNDMLKDVYAANKAGFKTALFAGDRQSLRMRKDDERTKQLNPDYIITELNQISDIVQ
jgi:putative hydrolase of the HAD superfamily